MSRANFLKLALKQEHAWGMTPEGLQALTSSESGLPQLPPHPSQQAQAEAQAEAQATEALQAAGLGLTQSGGYLTQLLNDTMPNGKTIALVNFAGSVISRAPAWAGSWGYINPQLFAATMTSLADNAGIGAIVINMDCNGGTVTGTQEAADAVAYATRKKPGKVIVVASDMCLSAAYWIASQASQVIASPTALVGSIGVITSHVDYSESLKAAGVVITFIRSVVGKARGQPYEPLSEEARAERQAMVNSLHAKFVSAVSKGRGKAKTAVADQWATGAVWVGAEAAAAGLADREATLSTVLAELTGKQAAPAVKVEAEPSPLDPLEDTEEEEAAAAMTEQQQPQAQAGALASADPAAAATVEEDQPQQDQQAEALSPKQDSEGPTLPTSAEAHKANDLEVRSMDMKSIIAKVAAGQTLTAEEQGALDQHLADQRAQAAAQLDTSNLPAAVVKAIQEGEAAKAELAQRRENDAQAQAEAKVIELGQPKSFASTYRKVATALASDPEALAAYEQSVKASAAQAALTAELGTSQQKASTPGANVPAGATVEQQLQARASAKMQANSGMSYKAACDAVFAEDPGFAARYANSR